MITTIEVILDNEIKVEKKEYKNNNKLKQEQNYMYVYM